MYSLVAVAFFKKYKTIIIGILLILAVFFFGFFISKSFWQAPLKEQIEKYEVLVKESNQKVKIAEDIAIEQSKKNEEKLKILEQSLDEISDAYDEEKKKKKVVTVKIPGEKIEVPIYIDDQNNSYYCDRFSSDFKDTINTMIESTNKTIGEEK